VVLAALKCYTNGSGGVRFVHRVQRYCIRNRMLLQQAKHASNAGLIWITHFFDGRLILWMSLLSLKDEVGESRSIVERCGTWGEALGSPCIVSAILMQSVGKMTAVPIRGFLHSDGKE
jgi:hypothetical protein